MTTNQYALHVAAHIRKMRPDLCLQACMFMAWRVAHLKESLPYGYYKFSYKKTNGEIRVAIGTTMTLLIPSAKRPKGIQKEEPNYATVAYYDFEKEEWRSFRTELFIE